MDFGLKFKDFAEFLFKKFVKFVEFSPKKFTQFLCFLIKKFTQFPLFLPKKFTNFSQSILIISPPKSDFDKHNAKSHFALKTR